jgi:hypothetical protein
MGKRYFTWRSAAPYPVPYSVRPWTLSAPSA